MPYANVFDKTSAVRGTGGTTVAQRPFPVAASTTIWKGDILTLDASGNAVPLITAVANAFTLNGANARVIGVALNSITTNASGVDATTTGGWSKTTVDVALPGPENEFLFRLYDATSSNTNPNDVQVGGQYKVGVYLASGLAATSSSRIYAVSPTTQAITGASNATPIVLTATAHGVTTGEAVYVSKVGGNTAANGIWKVTAATADTLNLLGSSANANYTSGGILVGSPVVEVAEIPLNAYQSTSDTYGYAWYRFAPGARIAG
jgi:hypothetical protein